MTQTPDFRLRIQVLPTLHIEKHSGKLPQNKTHCFLSKKLHLAYEKHTYMWEIVKFRVWESQAIYFRKMVYFGVHTEHVRWILKTISQIHVCMVQRTKLRNKRRTKWIQSFTSKNLSRCVFYELCLESSGFCGSKA